MNDLPDKKKILKSWVEAFRSSPTTSPGPTALLLASLVTVQNGKVPPEVENLFAYRVITKRLDSHGTKLSPDFVAMLAATCDNPAKAVMYSVYLSYMQHFLGATQLSALNLPELFPKGVPTDDAFRNLWSAQKVQVSGMASDNLLDYYTPEWLK